MVIIFYISEHKDSVKSRKKSRSKQQNATLTSLSDSSFEYQMKAGHTAFEPFS